jgi:hypothetical protein
MLTSVQHSGKLVIFVESLTILQKSAGVKTRIKELVSKEHFIITFKRGIKLSHQL